MDVVGLPEFLRCVRDSVRTERDDEAVDGFLHRLAIDHESAAMRTASIRIEGTDIHLWATDELRLSRGAYRITWRYEERSEGTMIVCFTLAET